MADVAAPAAPQQAQQAPAPAAGGAAADAPLSSGMLNFKVTAPSGDGENIGTEDYLQHLKTPGTNPALDAAGIQAVGASEDGQHIVFQNQKGKQFTAPITGLLQKQGYKIHEVAPNAPDYQGTVNPEWRAMVTGLGDDDDHKQAYIQSQMKKAGDPNRPVVGSGRNWYVYNHDTKAWMGVTNNPHEWGAADAAEAGVDATRIGGAVVGGGLGAMAGGPPGAMLGAGMGSAAAQGLTHAALSEEDPAYQQALLKPNSAGLDPRIEAAKGVAGNAALDAAGEGIAGGAIRGTAGLARNIINPASSAARAAGDIVGGIGEGVSSGTNWVRSTPVARWLLENTASPAAGITQAAEIAQAPQAAMEGGAEALKGAVNVLQGKSGPTFLRKMVAKLGVDAPDWLVSASEQVNKTGEPIPPSLAQRVAAFVGGHPQPEATPAQGAPQIGANIGEAASRGLSRTAASLGLGAEEMPRVLQDPIASFEARYGPISEETKQAIAQEAADDAAGQQGAKAGRGFGRAAESLGNVGTGVKNIVSGLTGGTLLGIEGLANVAKYTGQAAKAAGTVGAEVEPRAAVDEALHHYFGDSPDEFQAVKDAKDKYLRNRVLQSTMRKAQPSSI